MAGAQMSEPIFRCHDCGFSTDDSSQVWYAEMDENGFKSGDVFCPECGEVMEIRPEGEQPDETE